MFIFLGDSQPLGYELADEIDQDCTHIPQDVRDKVLILSAIDDSGGCRPDLAYPELLSKSLGQDYVNLAYGGTGHQRHLYSFQQYLKNHDVPAGSTVFLNSNCKERGFLVDRFTGQEIDFMNDVYMVPQTDFSIPLSDWHTYLNDEKNKNVCDVFMRISAYQNYQAVNYLGLLCDSLGINFLYFPISPCNLHTTDPAVKLNTREILTIRPDQIYTVPDDGHTQEYMNRPGHWREHHLSTQGHRALASDLKQVYQERFTT